MSLSFPGNHQFSDQLHRKVLLWSQRFKTMDESCSIPRYKLSLGILIMIMITNYTFQYPKNQYNKY